MEIVTLLLIGLIVALVLGMLFVCFLIVIGILALPLLLVVGGYWLDWVYDSIQHFFTYWRGGDGDTGML